VRLLRNFLKQLVKNTKYIMVKFVSHNGGHMSQSVERLSQFLMKAVVETGAVTEENAEKAVQVMRSELHEFLTGERYKNERESLLEGTMNERYVMASVVASCVERING
jgi:hypothetical protein